MTDEEARLLDAEVAEKVLPDRKCVDNGEGWCENCYAEMLDYRLMRYRQQGGPEPKETVCVPEYSTQIAAQRLSQKVLQFD